MRPKRCAAPRRRQTNGSVEVSGTVDEESGGFAGVAYLAAQKRLSTEHVDYVIIPEPLNVDRVCIGHRGVYWFELETRGRTAHGSMPLLGVSAIDHIQRELVPSLTGRSTTMPVVPDEARHATLNINGMGLKRGQVMNRDEELAGSPGTLVHDSWSDPRPLSRAFTIHGLTPSLGSAIGTQLC